VTTATLSNLGGFNLGGINASGQVPEMNGNWGLIDRDTPEWAYKRKSTRDDSELQLVFSDEFNVEGRSFYPGQSNITTRRTRFHMFSQVMIPIGRWDASY